MMSTISSTVIIGECNVAIVNAPAHVVDDVAMPWKHCALAQVHFYIFSSYINTISILFKIP